jgi:LAO/AO transport system kinase
VGVGQDEIDVVKVAQTSVVVLVPGLGDEIQAITAGLLEIADDFVVNKADRDGALRAEKDLKMLQSLGPHPAGDDDLHWEPPIVRTVATQREGIDALVAAVDRHREHLAAKSDADGVTQRARERARHVLESLVVDRVSAALAGVIDEDCLDQVAQRERDPWSEAERLFELIRRGRGSA